MADVHDMVMTGRIYVSGAVEWLCPECGRILAIHGPPAASIHVVERGDIYALHTGATPAALATEAPAEPKFVGNDWEWMYANGIAPDSLWEE